jgi:hypothetical protein
MSTDFWVTPLARILHEADRWVAGTAAVAGKCGALSIIRERTERTSAASRTCERSGEPTAYLIDTSRLERALTRSDRPLDGSPHAISGLGVRVTEAVTRTLRVSDGDKCDDRLKPLG